MTICSVCAFGQNYFSRIEVTDEFGKEKTTYINGRITVNDSTIVIKTPNGVYEQLNIINTYNHGTKEEPVEFEGRLYYEIAYICIANGKTCAFSSRTEVYQYTHNYKNNYWLVWYLDENYEVIKTVVFLKD